LLAPQDDGSLAVFAVDEAGAVTVVEAGWSDGTYASGVTVDPSGEVAWLTNESRSDVGGGVTAVVLDCDTGRPRLAAPDDGLAVDGAGQLLAADHPRAFLPVPWDLDRAIVVGRPVGGAETTDAALISLPDGAIVAEVDAFGPDAWLSAAALSADGQTLVVGDASAWSGRDNAVAQVAVSPDHTLTLLGTAEVYDPADIALSPDGGAALVASGFGDDLLFVALGDTGPALDGRVSASGDRPQLPGGLAAVDRGGDAALMLASEVYGLRRIDAVSASGMQPGAVVALDGDATPGLVVLQR
jgi:DNA-binding beta-propeller fold protein YncE